MAAPAKAAHPADSTHTEEACYIYGIVPYDVEPTEDARGVGDPPARLRAVRHEDIAALVSHIDPSKPLDRPEDLLAHQQLLDGVAGQAPVIPFRFGAVMTGEDAVVEGLLAPHHDGFAAALRELEGHVQYVVRGRYAEDVVLSEVLAEQPAAAKLREEIRAADDPDATRDARIRLGELISEAVTAKREADTRALGDAVAPYCSASSVREPAHELDAVHVALLAETSRRRDLERAVQELGRDWGGRAELRLVGPMAPYDFVIAMAPGG